MGIIEGKRIEIVRTLFGAVQIKVGDTHFVIRKEDMKLIEFE